MLRPDSPGTTDPHPAPDDARAAVRPPESADVPDIRVKLVRFKSASAGEMRTGLLAYVEVTINDLLRIDGLTVRCTTAGRVEIRFPERKDHRDRRHALVSPMSAAIRREIERQLDAALKAQGLPGGLGGIPGAFHVEV